MRSRRLVPVALAALVAVAGSACMSSPDVERRAAKPGARPGGVLRVGIGQPGSLEPTNAYEAAGKLVLDLLCDPLAELDPVTGELKPAVAESWQVSDDGTRITIRLRKGVKFHDGSEVEAGDVVFSLSRAASADYASFVAELLEPFDGYGELHGDVETERDRDRRELRGARVISSRSLELQLTRPHADIERLLGHPVMAPIPQDRVEDDPVAFAARPVCTGPYQLAEPWEPDDDVVTLTRFSGYHADNTGFTRGGAGYAARVEFHVFSDRSEEMDAFLAGDLDVAHLPADRVGEARQAGVQVVQAPAPAVEFVGGTISREHPYGRREVRLALSEALDRRRLADEVFHGAVIPARGFLPPTVGPAFRPDACGDHVPAEGEPAQARRRLSAAGIDLAGARIELSFNDEFGNAALAAAVADQWRESLGLEVDLAPMPWAEFLAAAQTSPGFEGLFRTSWTPPYPSADAALFPLFHSNGIGDANFERYSSLDFDRTLERARETDTAEDRWLDHARAEDILCQELPLIPLVFGASNLAVSDGRVDSAIETFTDLTTGEPVLRELFVTAPGTSGASGAGEPPGPTE